MFKTSCRKNKFNRCLLFMQQHITKSTIKLLKFTKKGIYCVPGKFHIDPWEPVDYAIITHGHGDHARAGMKHYLCHNFTIPILKSRLGPLSSQGLEYGESLDINGVKVSLHPAGHIIGSAQVRLEYKGRVIVVSGDYNSKMMDYQLLLKLLNVMNSLVKALLVSQSTIGWK